MDIRPCRLCDSFPELEVQEINGQNFYSYVCSGCDTATALYGTKIEALNAWNENIGCEDVDNDFSDERVVKEFIVA